MKGALLILVFIILVGIVLYVFELRWRRNNPSATAGAEEPEAQNAREKTSAGDTGTATAVEKSADESDASGQESSECCGLHLVCEKDSLSPMSADIVYYDDEELDRFAGRLAGSYTPEEEEEFRDVLMTLRPEDAPGWARSITQRHIELPSDVRDALLMIVNDRRNAARP